MTLYSIESQVIGHRMRKRDSRIYTTFVLGTATTTITTNNNTLFNHATFRSEKRSLKHVRAKTMYTINTVQYIQFIKNIYN